ncbi:hypothetical protein LWI29_027084 [Acer saccharum]|uniref:BHLH domain-containing protein n=1 Tax=Acer saccharum TaxID=4024 RepID=A0AA39SCY2_ACESA|nr:hypothetical protein LWI29_027084 [Acer saccharum]
MQKQTGCFDPNSMAEGAIDDEFSRSVPNSDIKSGENLKLSSEELSYHHHHQTNQNGHHQEDAAAVAAMDFELYNHLSLDICNNNTHLMQQVIHENYDPNQVLTYNQSNWNADVQETVNDIDFSHSHDQQHNGHHNFDINIPSSLPETAYSQTPDLLNLLCLPRSTTSNSSTISFANTNHTSLGFMGDLATPDSTNVSSILYDPVLHLNLPSQPPFFRELFQSIPHGYNMLASRGGPNSMFGAGNQDADGGQFDDRVLEFTRDIAGMEADGNMKKPLDSERQRRVQLKDKYMVLRSLVPNPTKNDRASVVGDAIEYIKELLRTVNELKVLVEKKRCGKERSKRHKTEDAAAAGDVESCNNINNGSLRSSSSWLQRKSKHTEVDVRISDDEVTIKLIQRKKIDCLLIVSNLLDELHLDLRHVAGGLIGDYYSFLFNTKIYEGASVYASSIANKLIEIGAYPLGFLLDILLQKKSSRFVITLSIYSSKGLN